MLTSSCHRDWLARAIARAAKLFDARLPGGRTRFARRRAIFALLAVVASGAFTLPTARAADAEPRSSREAEMLIQKGLGLREAGHDLDALPYFQRAHALLPNPRTVAQLGFAEQALGMWTEAETHLNQALAATGDSWVQKHRPVIQDSANFVQRQLGSVFMESKLPGADVLLDGRVVGKTPLVRPLRVPVGNHQFELRAAGHRSAEGGLAVEAGKSHHLALQPAPLDLQAAAREGAAMAIMGEEMGHDASPAEPPVYRRWWFWTGAVALAAGVVAISLAASRGEDPFPCGEAGSGRRCVR